LGAVSSGRGVDSKTAAICGEIWRSVGSVRTGGGGGGIVLSFAA
jgi:hypothetical protein